MGCGLRRKPVAVSQAICQDPHMRWPQWMPRSIPPWCCDLVMTSGAVAKACNTSTAAVAVFRVRSASPRPCPFPMSLSSPCRPPPLPLLPISARVPACVPSLPLSLFTCTCASACAYPTFMPVPVSLYLLRPCPSLHDVVVLQVLGNLSRVKKI